MDVGAALFARQTAGKLHLSDLRLFPGGDRLGSGHADYRDVTVQAVARPMADYDVVAQRLRAVPGVTRAAPMVDGQVMASQNGVNLGVLVRGLTAPDLKSLAIVSNALTPGALNGFADGDQVIIGTGLAQKLDLHPGGAITLIAPQGNVTPFGTTPRIKTYTVAGTFKIGMTQYDTSFIFMPLKEAQLF